MGDVNKKQKVNCLKGQTQFLNAEIMRKNKS